MNCSDVTPDILQSQLNATLLTTLIFWPLLVNEGAVAAMNEFMWATSEFGLAVIK